MGKFDHHFKMNEQDAVEYSKEVLHIFNPSSELECKEIGDGNINYIFRVEEKDTGKSIIIKHADITTRSNNTKVDPIHNCIEAEMLQKEYSLVPEMVPKVYHYDPIMCCIVMEDCRDYKNMRHELCKHKIFPGFAEQIAHFMAITLMGTSDLVVPIKEKRRLQEKFEVLTNVNDPTFPANAPHQTIDYILQLKDDHFARERFIPEVIPESMASDHRPVMVTCDETKGGVL